jgi:hypothetical protein
MLRKRGGRVMVFNATCNGRYHFLSDFIVQGLGEIDDSSYLWEGNFFLNVSVGVYVFNY